MPPGRMAAALVLVAMVTDAGRSSDRRRSVDDVVHPWALAIVDTPTPPTSSRRIDVSRWEDLLRAAELLGRPILRLRGGEGGIDGRLFYVADGPQSYVFGFEGTPVDVSRSGAYAPRAPEVLPALPLDLPPPAPARPVLPEPVTPPTPSAPAPSPAPSVKAPPAVEVEPAPQPPVPAPAETDPADAWLGPEIAEPVAESDLPSATVVERRIREMIHELLADFRKLPPSSDRLELGTEHVQRAIDMLHLGRYGVAQIELNKATRILREEQDQ